MPAISPEQKHLLLVQPISHCLGYCWASSKVGLAIMTTIMEISNWMFPFKITCSLAIRKKSLAIGKMFSRTENISQMNIK